LQKRKVDHLVLNFDAQFFQVLGKRRDHTPHRARTVQKFDAESLAFVVAQSAIAVGPSSVFEQITRLAQMVTQGVARVDGQIGLRRLGHVLVKHSGGQLAPQRREQRQFVGAGSTLGLEIAGHKIPAHPAVGVVKQLPVQPFKVHGQRNGLAHAHILELVAAGVKQKALKVPRVAMHQFGLDQITPIERATREGPGPLTRNE